MELPRYIGCASCVVSFLLLVCLGYRTKGRKFFACDWFIWWVLWATSSVGAVLIFTDMPVITLCYTLILTPALLFTIWELRWFGSDDQELANWLAIISWMLILSGVALLSVWVSWIIVRSPHLHHWTDWTPAFRELVIEGSCTWKDAFVAWAMPCGFACCMLIEGLIAAGASCQIKRRDMSMTEEQRLIDRVKQLALVLCMIVMVLYIYASVAATGDPEFGQNRENFRDEVLEAALYAFVLIGAYGMYNIGLGRFRRVAEGSKAAGQFRELLESEWAKGFMVLLVGPLVALFLCCGSGRLFSKRVRMATAQARNWPWSRILVKAQWCGIIYVSFEVGFAKATVVMLAWTNEALASWSLSAVSASIFAVGFALFLLPPTPGVPVYMVTGVVVASSAINVGWSFWSAMAWSVCVGFAIKMAFAAAAQKLIGEPLARSTAVRRLVGVDNVEIRAIQMILSNRKMTVAKVAILIGGPDWPVAVLCGLLRLELMPILAGITPVLFQSVIPCVCSGALLVAEDPKIKAFGDTMLALAGALQGVAGLCAGYYIQDKIENNFDELSERRAEDEDVATLAEESAAAEARYKEATSWASLPWAISLCLGLGVVIQEACLIVLAGPWSSIFGEKAKCFRAFSLVKSVSKDLDGNPFMIVLPLGKIVLIAFTVGCGLLAVFYIWAKVKTSDSASEYVDSEAEDEP
eukprot:NODE_1572_length_2433_cov_16.762359.p1 GENE.NODE_1572_length_2433_cov_16.762359~~NODE_1572_length_2433_cov_16.762359.p1  ORF type:complete len:745 (-),score=196.43 NODE_1572_length_2433_cov_16.762359:199-2277(-)